jgi:fibronectin type 3 domain-containing protein
VLFLSGEIWQARQAANIYNIYVRTRMRDKTKYIDSNPQKNNYYFKKSRLKACGNKNKVVSLQ